MGWVAALSICDSSPSAITCPVGLTVPWRWLVIAIALVWVTEAINTAVEELCDRVSPEFDPSIGRVKDIAAGGVLAASIASAVIGLLTLGPPFLIWLE